jgi:hypothetical protein
MAILAGETAVFDISYLSDGVRGLNYAVGDMSGVRENDGGDE